MPLVYFDASAMVKLLAEEPGSDLAAELWDGCDAPVASRLAYPEVGAALAAAARNHTLTAGALAGGDPELVVAVWDRRGGPGPQPPPSPRGGGRAATRTRGSRLGPAAARGSRCRGPSAGPATLGDQR